MTTVERPHLGWHTQGWSALRRWWVHREEHKRGEFNDDHWWEHRAEFEEDDEEEQPKRSAPEVGESALEEQPLSRWESLAAPVRTVALWVVGALAVVLLFDPPPWLLALALGGTGAALVLQSAAHQRAAEVLAHQVERERAELAAQAQRAERREQNRAEREAAQAERDEAARVAREAKRVANQEAHRKAQDDG